MSFKVKNADVRAIMSNEVAIFSVRKLEVKTIYWLSRLEKELVKNFRLFEEERIKLVNDLCVRDEKGRPVVQDGKFKFQTQEIRQELNKKIDELASLEIEIGIDKLKLPLEQLKDVINADEIILLEPFIDFEGVG